MKKSILLFISVNILVLLVPLIFMLALRFKINNGDVTDYKAMNNARIKRKTLPLIENFVINSKYGGLVVHFTKDSLSYLETDTADYKYLSYLIDGNTLYINYDFKKDSIDNPSIAKEMLGEGEDNEEYSDDDDNDSPIVKTRIGARRSVQIFLKNDIRSVDVKEGSFYYEESSRYKINKDLLIISNKSDVGVHAEYDGGNISQDSLLYKITNKINQSSLDLEFYFVKEIAIEAVNSDVNIHSLDFDNFDLKIDDNTPMNVDISKLKKMNIKYIK